MKRYIAKIHKEAIARPTRIAYIKYWDIWDTVAKKFADSVEPPRNRRNAQYIASQMNERIK